MKAIQLLTSLEKRVVISKASRGKNVLTASMATTGRSSSQGPGGDNLKRKQKPRRRTREGGGPSSVELSRRKSSLIDEVDKIMEKKESKRNNDLTRTLRRPSSKSNNTKLSALPDFNQVLRKQVTKLPKTPGRTNPLIRQSQISIEKRQERKPDNDNQKASSLFERELPGERDLFDVFSVPKVDEKIKGLREATAKNIENALCGEEPEAWQQYHELVEEMISDSERYRRTSSGNRVSEEEAEPITAWLRSERRVAPQNLHSVKSCLHKAGVINHAEFRNKVETQRSSFREKTNFDDKQYKMAQGSIFHLVNVCARQAKGQALPVLWEKVKEAGITDPKLLQNLLYVSATFSTDNSRKNARYARLAGVTILDVLDAIDSASSLNSNIDGDVENEEDLVDRTDEIAIFHDCACA